MINCNLSIKLKTQKKKYIKVPRTKISNKKYKKWNWKMKRKEDKDVLFLEEIKKRRKKNDH
jgi:hypothetical protein